MKTNKEKNTAHDAKMQDKMRPAPKEYQWEELDKVVKQWIVQSK